MLTNIYHWMAHLFMGVSLFGSTILFPYGGGTGTSTAPAYGQVLVGTSLGVYQLQATSTLGLGGGTVTSVASTWPIIGGPFTTTGTFSFGGLSTSSPIAAGAAVLYATGVNTVASAATSSIGVSAGLTNSGTLGSQVGGSALTLKQVENRSFSYATSSAWTATTTIPLGVGYAEVWQNVKCFTDAGTLNVDFYYNSTHMTNPVDINASTTVGTFSSFSNTTPTSGSKLQVDIGTPASSPTKISCTVQDQN